jgi:hypothetical protein
MQIGNSLNGIRIWSCNPGNENANPNNSLNNLTNAGVSYSYLNPLFDHTKSLASGTGLNELLTLTNGGNVLHQSLGTQGTNGYINYTSSYFGNNLANSVNYSTITTSGFRWSTFAWNIPSSIISSLGSGVSYQTLVFQFNNFSNPSSFTVLNGTASLGGISFYFYYRVEDSANPISITSGSVSQTNYSVISTPWINGNSNSSPSIGPGPNTSTIYNGSTGITTGGKFSVLSGGYALSNSNYTNNMYVYCRVGIPMSSPFSFSGISCYLET